MTAKLIQLILVTVTAVGLACGPATAGEKWKTYEMGESGQVVMFPMSPEEIAAENAKNAARPAPKPSKAAETLVVTYELAESGAVVAFPVTAEETLSARKPAAEKCLKRSAPEPEKATTPSVVVKEYELSECGEIIRFTRPNTEAEKPVGNY